MPASTPDLLARQQKTLNAVANLRDALDRLAKTKSPDLTQAIANEDAIAAGIQAAADALVTVLDGDLAAATASDALATADDGVVTAPADKPTP